LVINFIIIKLLFVDVVSMENGYVTFGDNFCFSDPKKVLKMFNFVFF